MVPDSKAGQLPTKINSDERPYKLKRIASAIRLVKAIAASDSILLVGLGGIEPPTSRLSGVRSNRLSYSPSKTK